MADILWQLAANLIPTVSGCAYQDIRKVTTEWNARLKHCGPPKIRGSMHPASPSTLFSPIFSLAREKIGPPEARQKRPRRNESLQARLLILCARFFLSKPQTEFAVWVFSMQICSNLSVSYADSSPGRGALNKEPPPAQRQEGVGLWVCRFGSEDVLLGLFVEEVHQLRTEAVLDGLVAAVDSADVDVGRRNDDDDVLAVGVDVQVQLGAHEL